jgi:hypothetical protein
MPDEASPDTPREPATVDQPAGLPAPPAVPTLAASPPAGRGSGNVLTMIAIGVAGMVLGAVVGAGATAAIDNWADRHGPRSDRGPAWFDEGPRR